MQYVLLTISNRLGEVIKYSSTLDRQDRFKQVTTYFNELEGLTISTFDTEKELNKFYRAMQQCKKQGAKYIGTAYS